MVRITHANVCLDLSSWIDHYRTAAVVGRKLNNGPVPRLSVFPNVIMGPYGRMRKPFGVNRYEWVFSFPEPDWWGTIFRDVGAQSVGKRSEVSEILRPFSSAA
jgi:hypothetical protein